jgi:hypothetical protein
MTIQSILGNAQAHGTRSELQVSMLDGSVNTYGVASGSLSAFNGQLLQMAGNASNVVRITHIDVSLTALAVGVTTVSLQRFQTTASGGSPSGFNTAKNDPSNPGAQSQLVSYGSAPLGGVPTGGNIRSAALEIGVGGTAPTVLSWDFGNGPKQGLILRGVSDFMGLLIGAIAGTTNATISWEWTESPT